MHDFETVQSILQIARIDKSFIATSSESISNSRSNGSSRSNNSTSSRNHSSSLATATVSSNLFEVGFKLECAPTGGTYARCQAWKVLGLRHVNESMHLARWKPYEVESATATAKPRYIRDNVYVPDQFLRRASSQITVNRL